VLVALDYHRSRLNNYFSITTLFPKSPNLYFGADQQCCCEHTLYVLKTTKKKVATISIGTFYAYETKLICRVCKHNYGTTLTKIVPAKCRFGFDVIEYVGKALFIRYRQDAEIQEELKEKNIAISLREIAYLGEKFIVYLALAHQENQDKIKQHLQLRGGYILHLDGTCEADSPHLISSIDSLSKIVLGNLKIPSESASKIVPFLEKIKKDYGEPIALVHDMGNAIISSAEKVFPKTPDYICHFHFLKDIGKDLFGFQYSSIRKYIKTYRIRSKLREILKKLKEIISKDTGMQNCLREYLASNDLKKPTTNLAPVVSEYIAIAWVLEANSVSNGFGFPFDRPHLDFYLRLKEVYPILKELQQKIDKNEFRIQLSLISKFLNDRALKKTIDIIQQKIICFDKLRVAMRIAMPDNKLGLNDGGDDINIKTIKEKVTAFRQSDEVKKLASIDITYNKMLKQIDKYWEKLFADPIKVTTSEGVISIQPQRTNNIMEQFFRYLKRGYRKKIGTHSLSKVLKSMLADTPLVKNLVNPEYLKIILNGQNSLAERFAEIDVKQVRETMANEKKAMQKYPTGMAKIFKIPHLPRKLANSTMEIVSPS